MDLQTPLAWPRSSDASRHVRSRRHHRRLLHRNGRRRPAWRRHTHRAQRTRREKSASHLRRLLRNIAANRDGSYNTITKLIQAPPIVSQLQRGGDVSEYLKQHRRLTTGLGGIVVLILFAAGAWTVTAERGGHEGHLSQFLHFAAPAGNRPTTTNTVIDGVSAAVLPNGRLVTPAGIEVNVLAPKPFGLALSPDGRTLATLNSGAGPFSLTLIKDLTSAAPTVKRIDLNASFMGVVFSPDSKRVYLSGGETGNLWIADADAGQIVGSVNLNGAAHPLDRPLSVTASPQLRFKGAFPGNMALNSSGRFLYVVDQGGFKVHAIDTSLIRTGVDALGRVTEPDNFAAVIGRVAAGRHPFGIGLTADDHTLLVTNAGVFQYTHLRPASPTGNDDVDYPLCIPGAGYPDETQNDRVITIRKVDPRNLPDDLQDPDGIRCGYGTNRVFT